LDKIIAESCEGEEKGIGSKVPLHEGIPPSDNSSLCYTVGVLRAGKEKPGRVLIKGKGVLFGGISPTFLEAGSLLENHRLGQGLYGG